MASPSPYRIRLLPLGRVIDCPRTVKDLRGAKRFCRDWVADVGVSGSIVVEEGAGTEWKAVTSVPVVNETFGRWTK